MKGKLQEKGLAMIIVDHPENHVLDVCWMYNPSTESILETRDRTMHGNDVKLTVDTLFDRRFAPAERWNSMDNIPQMNPPNYESNETKELEARQKEKSIQTSFVFVLFFNLII